MFAAGDYGGSLAAVIEIDRRLDGAATGVAHDQNEACAGHGAGELHAAEDFFFGHVAGDADDEGIADAEVEDELHGTAGVDATEHDGHRELRGGGGVHLAGVVAR